MKKTVLIVVLLILSGMTLWSQDRYQDYSTLLPGIEFSSNINQVQDPWIPEMGWSTGAAKFGKISSFTILGFCLVSELTKYYTIPSLPLGASATLIILGSVPIVYSGAMSATTPPETGKNLKTLGWVAYGGSLVSATFLIALGVMEITPEPMMILTTGLIGATSAWSMARYATTRGKYALDHYSKESSRLHGSGLKMGIVPVYKGAGLGFAYKF